MISSKLCSSTNDNTSYIVTQLSKNIKAGLLPQKFHIVLDEAYPCTVQEMSPWKGRNLSVERDAFNYYSSLNQQVIERAFGILVQRWGIFWRPLKVSMHNRGVAVRVACRLHNVCVAEFGEKKMGSISRGAVQGFEFETITSRMITVLVSFCIQMEFHLLDKVTGRIWSAVHIEICGQILSGKMV